MLRADARIAETVTPARCVCVRGRVELDKHGEVDNVVSVDVTERSSCDGVPPSAPRLTKDGEGEEGEETADSDARSKRLIKKNLVFIIKKPKARLRHTRGGHTRTPAMFLRRSIPARRSCSGAWSRVNCVSEHVSA